MLQLIRSLEKAYVISVHSIEDIKNLYKSLGLVRSLLMVQVCPDEEDLLKQSIWSAVLTNITSRQLRAFDLDIHAVLVLGSLETRRCGLFLDMKVIKTEQGNHRSHFVRAVHSRHPLQRRSGPFCCCMTLFAANALECIVNGKANLQNCPSPWDFVTLTEEDRATAVGNTHKNLVKIARAVPETSCRTDRQTNATDATDHNTSPPLRRTNNKSLCDIVLLRCKSV